MRFAHLNPLQYPRDKAQHIVAEEIEPRDGEPADQYHEQNQPTVLLKLPEEVDIFVQEQIAHNMVSVQRPINYSK